MLQLITSECITSPMELILCSSTTLYSLLYSQQGALPDLGQSPLEDEALPLDAPPLMQDAITGAALGNAVAADTGLPQALLDPRAQLEPCLLPSQSAGVQRVQTVSEEEAHRPHSWQAKPNARRDGVATSFDKTSGGVIDTLLRNLHQALGHTLLRWGCLKDFEERFLGYSCTVILPRRA